MMSMISWCPTSRRMRIIWSLPCKTRGRGRRNSLSKSVTGRARWCSSMRKSANSTSKKWKRMSMTVLGLKSKKSTSNGAPWSNQLRTSLNSLIKFIASTIKRCRTTTVSLMISIRRSCHRRFSDWTSNCRLIQEIRKSLQKTWSQKETRTLSLSTEPSEL